MKMSKCFIQICLFVLLMGNSFLTINAQITSTSTSTTISTSSSDDDSSTSVSTSNSNYKFSSSFDKKFTSEVEKFLVKKLGSPSSNSSNRNKYWNTINGKEIENLKVKLSKGKIKIDYSSEEEDDATQKQIAKLALQVSKMISEESGITTLRFEGDLEF